MDFTIDNIDAINARKIHLMTTTNEQTIQLLRDLRLLPTKPSDNDSCAKECNDWYTGKFKGIDGMLIKTSIHFKIEYDFRLFIPMS